MKHLIIFLLVLLAACTPETWLAEQSFNPHPVLPHTASTTPVEDLRYDSLGRMIPDFVPALQPYLHEACETAWDNISAIINPDGSITYFTDLPDYTEDSLDYDKNRFEFSIQSLNPWYGQDGDSSLYTLMQVGWYTLPVDDYGNLTCSGLQEIRIWVRDKVTGQWYFNSQVCYAVILCNGQTDCNQGYSYDQIEYTSYEPGYIYSVNYPYSTQ
jgi:hypothetical protein